MCRNVPHLVSVSKFLFVLCCQDVNLSYLMLPTACHLLRTHVTFSGLRLFVLTVSCTTMFVANTQQYLSCQPLHAVGESRRPICPSVSCAEIVASSVCASLHFQLRTRFTFRTLPHHTITLGINSSACTALSTLGITSQLLALRLTSVLRHNAANFSCVTQG